MCLDNKHFPMLRKYEEAKMNMMNSDIDDMGNSTFNSMAKTTGRTPFQNFCRSTAGKKLYYNDPACPMPPPKLEVQTKLGTNR